MLPTHSVTTRGSILLCYDLLPCSITTSILLLGFGAVTTRVVFYSVLLHTVLPCSILLLGFGPNVTTRVQCAVTAPCSTTRVVLLGLLHGSITTVTHTVLLPCSILLLGFGACYTHSSYYR